MTNVGIVQSYAAGRADEDAVNDTISHEWRQLLANEPERKAVAEILRVPVASLAPESVPFRAVIARSGISGAEIAIQVAEHFVADAALHVTLMAIKEVWRGFMERRVNPPASDVLGERKEEENDDE